MAAIGEEKQRILGKVVMVKGELAEVSEDSSSAVERRVVTGGGGGKKGSGGGGGGGGMRCCQAEKCVADLTDAKPYYRRHKVCENHSKAQIVLVEGIRQRFCQQCSSIAFFSFQCQDCCESCGCRFHELSEFDDTKRSCRRLLAGHNQRRRKNVGESNAAEGSEERVYGQVDYRRRIKITIRENVSYEYPGKCQL